MSRGLIDLAVGPLLTDRLAAITNGVRRTDTEVPCLCVVEKGRIDERVQRVRPVHDGLGVVGAAPGRAGTVCQTGIDLECRCNAGNCDRNGGAAQPENTDARCRDGIDNDCDTAMDCADPDCAGRPCDATGITACQCVGGVRKEMACADGDSATDCGDGDGDCAGWCRRLNPAPCSLESLVCLEQ